MLNNKKHIIFDWNGTIVNDAWVFIDILNELLIPRGLNPITMEKYRSQFCFPIKSFYKKLGLNITTQAFNELEKEFVNHYNNKMYNPKLFDNVTKTLKKLIDNNFKLSILSASNEKVLNELVKYYSLNQYFDYIVGVDNYGANGKIESGKDLIDKLKLNNKQIILIGDTDYDYKVATKLNIDCFLKINGHQSYNQLKAVTSNIINSFDDIYNML